MIDVLVTGANGQLGKTIKDVFSEDKESIHVVYVSRRELDISNKSEIKHFFNENSFNYCINCAAYTNVEQAEISPEDAIKVNTEAVKNIAEICKKNKVTLIHISTDYVFDGKKCEPYNEEDKTNPINQYGKSKLLGEHYIQDILKEYFIIRTSWLYSKHGKNFVKTIVSKIQENTTLEITTSQKGTPTSCIDLAKFIYHIIKTKEVKYGIYHFSAFGDATWYDFAIQISKPFKTSNITSVNTFSSKAKRPNYSVLNNSKANKIYSKINNWQDSVDVVVKGLFF